MKKFDLYGAPHLNRLQELVDLQWGIIGNSVHLIASSCYPFSSVLSSLSEPSFILPAEGMPNQRYLPGSKVMDYVEIEGEELVKNVFGLTSDYRVNLQPHSGTQANQIVYNSVLTPEDRVLCLKASDGGHISHTVLIGRRNQTFNFGLTSDGDIDYASLEALAEEVKPKLIIIGGSALPRKIDFERCHNIAFRHGAYLHADVSHTATFIAAGLHPNAFPFCDFVTFNTVKNLRGPNSGIVIYRDVFSKKIAKAVFPDTQGGANETNMLGKYATFLEWQKHDLRRYAERIVACSKIVVDTLKKHKIKIITGGSDCHIVLLQLEDDWQTGAHFEKLFESRGILLNKNQIPSDKRGPSLTSGLRIGTTNLAILGYKEEDIQMLIDYLALVILGNEKLESPAAYLTQKYKWAPDT